MQLQAIAIRDRRYAQKHPKDVLTHLRHVQMHLSLHQKHRNYNIELI